AWTAWLAPLPPGNMPNISPRIVSPFRGRRVALATKSNTRLPTTTIRGFFLIGTCRFRSRRKVSYIPLKYPKTTRETIMIRLLNFLVSPVQLAFDLFGWPGVAILVVVLIAAIWGLYQYGGQLFMWLLFRNFAVHGKVLRGAKVEIHS